MAALLRPDDIEFEHIAAAERAMVQSIRDTLGPRVDPSVIIMMASLAIGEAVTAYVAADRRTAVCRRMVDLLSEHLQIWIPQVVAEESANKPRE